MSLSVLIVDDHVLVRAGLKLVLEAAGGIEVVGEAGSAEEGIRQARLLKPGIVLMDVVMPGVSGIDALPEVLKAAPLARVLVLSMEDDVSYVKRAFANGASGYVLKEAADTELVQAVRKVAAGGNHVHPALGARLAAAETEARNKAAEDPLTEREREVLRLLALGHTNQEIAKMLYISVRTTESHRARIMQKLRLSARAGLVQYAVAHRLLTEQQE